MFKISVRTILILVVLLTTFINCTGKGKFFESKNFKENIWHKDSIFNVDVGIQDTIGTNNIFIVLNNNNSFSFSNILMEATIKIGNETVSIDTLEYEMADEKGNWLGSGFSSIKENKLVLRENIKFPNNKNVSFMLRHLMRERDKSEGIEKLEGINRIGLLIE